MNKLGIQWLRRKFQDMVISILGATSKLGVQCQEKGGAVYEYNRVVQPNSIKAINIVDRDFWQRIWDENPRLQYAIYRECPNGPEPWNNPEGVAAAWISHLKSKIGHLVESGLINVIEGYNEWVHSFQVDQFPAADRFMAALISETHRQFGGKAHIIVLNASCGHFSSDIVKFPKTLAALNQCPKCMLGLHEYDRDDMDRTQPWRCGKFQLVEQALDGAGYQNVSFALTEVGLDDCVERPVGSPHRGWRYYGVTVEEAVAHFLNSHNLAWYYPLLMASGRVKLASIFGCSMYWGNNNWGDMGFDLANRDGSFPTGLLDGIKNLEDSPPEPPEPPEEPKMDLTNVRVFELKPKGGHTELTTLKDKEALVVAKYGAVFRRAEVASGQKVYRLTELWEKTGHSSLITQVLNEQGQPMANVDVAFYWPGAPDQSAIATIYDWFKKFVHGLTNKDGDVGPGMGPGAYHGEGEGGPHAVWVRDPDIPSDICEKLGMLAGTFHDHLDQKFQLMVQGGEEEPPPVPGELVAEYVETVEQPHDSTMHGIAIILENQAHKDWMWDIRGKSEGPGVYEEIHPEEERWTYPATGEQCALTMGCCDYGGTEGETRPYSFELFRLPDRDTILAGPKTLAVKPMNQENKRRVIHVYRLVAGEEEPEPEPEPQPPNVQAFAEALADLGTGLSEAWAAFAAKMKEIG